MNWSVKNTPIVENYKNTIVFQVYRGELESSALEIKIATPDVGEFIDDSLKIILYSNTRIINKLMINLRMITKYCKIGDRFPVIPVLYYYNSLGVKYPIIYG